MVSSHMTKHADEPFSEQEAARRYQATLARILATPPDHKTKPNANPKKRGRPPSTTMGVRHHPKTEDRRDTWFPPSARGTTTFMTILSLRRRRERRSQKLRRLRVKSSGVRTRRLDRMASALDALHRDSSHRLPS